MKIGAVNQPSRNTAKEIGWTGRTALSRDLLRRWLDEA